MAKINCPKCGAESTFSLVQPTYQGPFRCGQCKEMFSIRIENNELKSCQPIGKQEVDKLNIRKHY